MSFEIIEQTANWVALVKPSGFHVHPPEDRFHKVPREKIILHQLRDQLNTYVYPVHRLDGGTCGVLLMALNKETAGYLAGQFQGRKVKKLYHAAVRGWAQDEGSIEIPLELDSTGDLVEAKTDYRTLARIEFPIPVGRRHSTARYSLVEATPHTGRYHQIRRHLNRIAHPILGDATHGDSHHNRFFREQIGIQGLCLKAHELEFESPDRGWIRLESPDPEKWQRIRDVFKS